MSYYNPNPKGKLTGDCVIRALSKALNEDWYSVYDDLCEEGKRAGDWGNTNSVWGAYLRRRGFDRYIIPNYCPNCYTLADFAQEHDRGTYIVATGTHVVCIKDGVIYDSWDSSREIPTYYFKEADR